MIFPDFLDGAHFDEETLGLGFLVGLLGGSSGEAPPGGRGFVSFA